IDVAKFIILVISILIINQRERWEKMSNGDMQSLSEELDTLNLEILELVNKRAAIVKDIGEIKGKQSTRKFDPVRERDMLDHIIKHNDGPFKNATVEHIFKEIF